MFVVWSTSDDGGVDLTVREIGNATGIFEGTLFVENSDNGARHLLVSKDDVITVKYNDSTPPYPYDTSDEFYVKDAHIVTNEPLKRTSIGYFKLFNVPKYVQDDKVHLIVSDKPVYMRAYIEATQDRIKEECVFIIQIENANNEVVYLKMSNHSLGDRYDHIKKKWIPDMPGTYTITAFIWESIDNPVPLSPKMEKTVLVMPTVS